MSQTTCRSKYGFIVLRSDILFAYKRSLPHPTLLGAPSSDGAFVGDYHFAFCILNFAFKIGDFYVRAYWRKQGNKKKGHRIYI